MPLDKEQEYRVLELIDSRVMPLHAANLQRLDSVERKLDILVTTASVTKDVLDAVDEKKGFKQNLMISMLGVLLAAVLALVGILTYLETNKAPGHSLLSGDPSITAQYRQGP